MFKLHFAETQGKAPDSPLFQAKIRRFLLQIISQILFCHAVQKRFQLLIA